MAGVTVGQAVRVNDENRVDHDGIVTAVHGTGDTPSINAVYVSGDPSKNDPYGRQVERLSSLIHKSQTATMINPGRYWE